MNQRGTDGSRPNQLSSKTKAAGDDEDLLDEEDDINLQSQTKQQPTVSKQSGLKINPMAQAQTSLQKRLDSNQKTTPQQRSNSQTPATKANKVQPNNASSGSQPRAVSQQRQAPQTSLANTNPSVKTGPSPQTKQTDKLTDQQAKMLESMKKQLADKKRQVQLETKAAAEAAQTRAMIQEMLEMKRNIDKNDQSLLKEAQQYKTKITNLEEDLATLESVIKLSEYQKAFLDMEKLKKQETEFGKKIQQWTQEVKNLGNRQAPQGQQMTSQQTLQQIKTTQDDLNKRLVEASTVQRQIKEFEDQIQSIKKQRVSLDTCKDQVTKALQLSNKQPDKSLQDKLKKELDEMQKRQQQKLQTLPNVESDPLTPTGLYKKTNQGQASDQLSQLSQLNDSQISASGSRQEQSVQQQARRPPRTYSQSSEGLSEKIGVDLKQKVAQEIKDKGLQVDLFKRGFQKRQASQELILRESQRDSLKNIQDHKAFIKSFAQLKAQKESQIKELKESNAELQTTLKNLILDQHEAEQLLKQSQSHGQQSQMAVR